VDILVSCTVRATQPAALNDPFEMAGCPTQEEILRFASAKPDAIPGLAEALTIDTDRLVERIRHECSSLEKAIIAQSGVICVSSEWDIAPMWAHHCDNHKGFVIGFNGNAGVFRRVEKVIYTDTPASFGMDPTPESVATGIRTKASTWSYEKECRVVGLLSECRDTGRDDFRGHRIYLYTLPPRCISEITLGARMDAEYGGRLSGLAKARGARVFQATYDIGSPRLVREEVT
jgi:hypothetical protein